MSQQGVQSVYINTVPPSSSWDTTNSTFQRISIANPSSSTGLVTVSGGGRKDGAIGNGMTLAAGQSVTISVVSEQLYLVGITIQTASGTTAQIIAQ